MSNKAASLTGALLSGKDTAAAAPGPATPPAAEGGDPFRQFSLPLDAARRRRLRLAAAMIDGRTVMEVPGEARSAEEIVLLWEYLGKRLRREHGTMLPTSLLSVAPKEGDSGVRLSGAPE